MENQLISSEMNLLAIAENSEKVIQEALLEKAVAQGKFEIATDVLHDIGNAVVGFGSHLTRINRSVEQNNPENLENLAHFFTEQHGAMVMAIGELKAGAVVSMLNSIVAAQNASQEEMRKSISEQLNIISHIQEILNVQRQYISGHDPREKKPANLRSLLNDCLSMTYASLDKRNIHASLQITVESPVIQGDRTKLMQVILNILKNSIEAIELNGTEKTISISLYEEEDLLILQVKDSGNGFDEATAGRLFNRGFTTKSSGTGLGLNNCRHIIESHAGTITITSEGPGKGALTTIKFKYPTR